MNREADAWVVGLALFLVMCLLAYSAFGQTPDDTQNARDFARAVKQMQFTELCASVRRPRQELINAIDAVKSPEAMPDQIWLHELDQLLLRKCPGA